MRLSRILFALTTLVINFILTCVLLIAHSANNHQTFYIVVFVSCHNFFQFILDHCIPIRYKNNIVSLHLKEYNRVNAFILE